MSDAIDLYGDDEPATPNWLRALYAVIGALVLIIGLSAIITASYNGEKLLNERIASCVENGGSWDGGQEDCTLGPLPLTSDHDKQ